MATAYPVDRSRLVKLTVPIDRIAGPDAILLPKGLAAQVCGKSYTWIERMVAAGRLPTVAVGRARWIQRAALVEALAVGV
jgi:excisionase family DNA binding protein